MRLTLTWFVLVFVASPVRAAEIELRPPETRLEVALGPRERPAKVRVFWNCFAADLGVAARSWLGARAARADCAADAALLAEDSSALQRELETAAGGKVLGDPDEGEVRSIDAAPGREKQLTANFCYAATDVEHITGWTRRQLASLCSEDPPAE